MTSFVSIISKKKLHIGFEPLGNGQLLTVGDKIVYFCICRTSCNLEVGQMDPDV